MTKKEAFDEINYLQDEYVGELISIINSSNYEMMKTINFTSATGTGKTKMMSKLINHLPEYYFIVTTLSKGQLHIQVRNNLERECLYNNYIVYGSADYRINSRLEAEDIIENIPKEKKCIWLRDEGHIRTNRFDELLSKVCYKVINFSATNVYSDVICNFAQTMMLRTVNQNNGTPEKAIEKLLEIKASHRKISGYNPCAIFRCVSGDESLYKRIIRACNINKLKYIDITEDPFIMAELCKDDNEYDVIINKLKIVEGIDIRRAHVLFMDNQPGNNATTIQVIGRCRRNALLYRDDVDILSPQNRKLLEQTRECYVYYNIDKMKINTDDDGELQYAFCNHISCESLKAGTTISVYEGQLTNGLHIIELFGKTGTYKVVVDEETGFNVVEPISGFYDEVEKYIDDNYIYASFPAKIHVDNIGKLPLHNTKMKYDGKTGKPVRIETEPYYSISPYYNANDVMSTVDADARTLFKQCMKRFTKDYIISRIKDRCLDKMLLQPLKCDIEKMANSVNKYIKANEKKKGYKTFCIYLSRINRRNVVISGFLYKLNQICSANELVVLAFYCIQRKEEGNSQEEIEEYVDNYIKLKCKYLRIIYAAEYDVRGTFGDISIGEDDFDKISEEVNCYLKTNADKKDKHYFCGIVTHLLGFTRNNVHVYRTDDIFTDEEIKTIQYCCIIKKESGESDDNIIKCINEAITLRYKFYLLRDYREHEKFAYIVLNEDIKGIYKSVWGNDFILEKTYPEDICVSSKDVELYFNKIECCISDSKESSRIIYIDSDVVSDLLIEDIERVQNQLDNNVVPRVSCDFSVLFRRLTDVEEYMLRNKYIKKTYAISQEELRHYHTYRAYVKVVNDRESAIIGTDIMRQIRLNDSEVVWTESKAVSSKIGNYNKFNLFLSRKYAEELLQAKDHYFYGKNTFNLDKRLNSMIGYCVEYYSKYIVYGEAYLSEYIDQVKEEARVKYVDKYIIIRACMLKYKEMMTRCFGIGVSKFIKGIPISKLSNRDYEYFVELIVKLGEKTARFVMDTLYKGIVPVDDIDANLSIDHIEGLADYITEDTILDVKVRNNIDEKCIRQVLAYHYLSTKRSDLCIKHVIVYDAVSGMSITINITDENIKK